MTFRQQIPNILTTINLAMGFLAMVYLFKGYPLVVLCCIAVSMLADLLDGWAARKLGVAGPLGVQLDSLADMVSFGALPAAMVIQMNGAGTGSVNWWYGLVGGLALVIAAFWRLAKFNIDTRQQSGFLGVPTPAMSLVITGLFFAHTFQPEATYAWLWQNMPIAIQSILLAILMSIEITVPSFKDLRKHKGFFRTTLAAIAVTSIVIAIMAPYLLLWQALLVYICSALIYSLIIKK